MVGSSPSDSSLTIPRQSRILACEECSRRKQRCDKLLPTCTPCRKAGSTCSRSHREHHVLRSEDNSVTRKGHVRLLEEKVALLEEKAREKGLLPSSSGGDEVSASDNGLGAEDLDHAQRGSGWRLQNANMNMKSLSLSAMAEPRSRSGEFLKELAMPRIIAGMTETYGGNPEVTSRLDSLWDGIARDIRHPSNSQGHRLHLQRGEATRSLETYLDKVDFRFPRLQVGKVQAGIDAICSADEDAYSAILSTNPAHIFMAYMVVAIVPLVSDSYPISHGSFVSIHILAKCLRVLDRVFHQEDGVDIIQCLHLLVVFAIHSSTAGSSWHLIGFAMNKCIALGYHREGSSLEVSEDEAQQRRWAFWGCYLLETLICGALDRPLSIDDRYVTVSLPGELSASPEATPALSDAERQHVRLFRYARLMSSILHDSESDSFESQLSRLLHWRSLSSTSVAPGLEKAYAHETSLFNTLMLRAAIQQVNRSFSKQNNSGAELCRVLENDARRMRILDICRSVVQSFNRITMSGRSYLSVITGYSALSTGLAIVFWNVCTNGNDMDTTSTLLESILAKLDVVSRQFPRMQDYRRLVSLLQGEAIKSCARGSGLNETMSETEHLVSNVGPDHVRSFARVITTCLAIRYSSVVPAMGI